jgi:hypothetical protein
MIEENTEKEKQSFYSNLYWDLKHCIEIKFGAEKDELSIEKIKKLIKNYYWLEDLKIVD